MNEKFLNYIRHLSKEDQKTLSQKVLKIFEEGGELASFALPFDSAYATNHRFVERENILEEAVDTVLCAMSVAYHLDFTDEEIEQMMERKAEKWARLQANEKDLKYPIPFEIHITVNATGHKTIDMFKHACHHAGVKPIIIDLENNGHYIKSDVMTSSKHFGTNSSAYREMEGIVRDLQDHNFEVVRKKIETVPWHPAAPRSLQHDQMPTNCYFEAHIPVTLPATHRSKLADALRHDKEVHISSNPFKKHEDGKETIMLTYRTYEGTLGMFEGKVDRIVHHLTIHSVESWSIGKPMKEFSIYDTKVSHDAQWLTAN